MKYIKLFLKIKHIMILCCRTIAYSAELYSHLHEKL